MNEAPPNNTGLRDVNQVLGKQTPQRTKYQLENVNTTTDLSKIKQDHKIELYEQLGDYLINNKPVKGDYKPLIKDLIKTVKQQQIQINQLKNKINEAQAQKSSNAMKAYNNYADCVNNKLSEHPIIISKSDLGKDRNIDVSAITFEKLKPIKQQIELRSVKENNDKLIISAVNEEQRDLIINQLKEVNTIKAQPPKPRLPSIIVTEIEKVKDLKSKEDYKNYILNELVENDGISKDKTVIKVVMFNANFKTVRCIVNFDLEDTKKVVNKGYVKVGYKICPIIRTVNVIQCLKCLKFGHFEKDLQGNTTCKCNSFKCNYCAGDHKESECEIKKNNGNKKCSNCSKSHTADYKKCEVREKMANNILSKCVC